MNEKDSMKRIKVLLGPSTFGAMDPAPMDRLVQSGCEVIPNPWRRKLTKGELLDLLTRDVKGLIAGLEVLDEEVLRHSKLEVISRCGSGMSNVDIGAAERMGIKVYSTPFGPTNAVAELTLGCLLSLLRELHYVNGSMHSKKWEKRIGSELRAKKVAVIGFGRIGQRTGQLLEAFGAKVIAVDPAYDDSHAGVRKASLAEALGSADVITLHSSSTKRLLGDAEFELMKPGVFLLNAARGELIDEKALMRALDCGKVAGAWLDTFVEEPYKGPLCEYAQVILTPHLGSYTVECRRYMETEAADNLLKGLFGKED